MRAVRIVVGTRRNQFDGVRAEHREVADILLPHRDGPAVVGVGLRPVSELMTAQLVLRRCRHIQRLREFDLLPPVIQRTQQMPIPKSTPRASLPAMLTPFASVWIEYPSPGPAPRVIRIAGAPEAACLQESPCVRAATSPISISTAFFSGPANDWGATTTALVKSSACAAKAHTTASSVILAHMSDNYSGCNISSKLTIISPMTMPRPLRGIITPLVTPLLNRDELDTAGLERLVERVITAGCSGVFVLGSTGEAQALSYRLRLDMVRETVRLAAERVPVLTGITDTSIVESIDFGNASVEAGASALVTAPPYYFRLSQRDLLRHSRTLADELAAPLFLYNMPSMTKLVYDADTVAVAAEHPNIIGFKDSGGDLIYFQRVLRLVSARPDFSVLIGPEELLGQAVLLGAHGGIAGGSNLRPEIYVALYNAAAQHNFEDMVCLERRIMDLSEHVYRVGDPVTSYFRGLKCALGLEGICSEIPAAPLQPFDDAERDKIREWLRH